MGRLDEGSILPLPALSRVVDLHLLPTASPCLCLPAFLIPRPIHRACGQNRRRRQCAQVGGASLGGGMNVVSMAVLLHGINGVMVTREAATSRGPV
jgi:hypothetical protein